MTGLEAELAAILDARAPGTPTSEDDVAVVDAAAVALAATDPGLVMARLGVPETPTDVQRAAISALYPAHVTLGTLAALVPPDRRVGLVARLLTVFRMAVATGKATRGDLLPWFAEETSWWSGHRRLEEVATSAVYETLADAEVGDEAWESAMGVMGALDGPYARLEHWRPEASAELGVAKRVAVVLSLLDGGSVFVDAQRVDDLGRRGLVDPADCLAWLDLLAAGFDTERPGAVAAAAVEYLAPLVAVRPGLLADVRQTCGGHERLRVVGEGPFGVERVGVAVAAAAAAAASRDLAAVAAAAEEFSAARLEALLDTGAVADALEETRRRRPPGWLGSGPRPVDAWPVMTEGSRTRLAALSVEALARLVADPGAAGSVPREDLVEMVAVVNQRDPGAFVRLGPEGVVRLLEFCLLAGQPYPVGLLLPRASDAAPETTAGLLLGELERQLRTPGPVCIGGWLGTGTPEAVLGPPAERALAVAAEPDVAPGDLGGLLGLASLLPRLRPDVTAAALRHLETEGRPDSDDLRRAEAAAGVLLHPLLLEGAVARLLAALDGRPDLTRAAVARAGQGRAREALARIGAMDLARVHRLLTAGPLAPSPRQPGEVYTLDPVESLAHAAYGELTTRGDRDSELALRWLATTTDNVYVLADAVRAAQAAAEQGARPTSAEEVLEILDRPGSRVVRSRAQLACLVLDELHDLAEDLAKDRALRRLLWERQRDGTTWTGTWVPAEEVHVSDFLKAELCRRLGRHVALVREAQIQPALSGDSADEPDLLVLAFNHGHGNTVDLPVEVKCSYNPRVVKDIRDQLAHRYLKGPAGHEGVYVVVHFAGDRWDPTDVDRIRNSARYSAQQTRDLLEMESRAVVAEGVVAHHRVIEVPLSLADAATGSPL